MAEARQIYSDGSYQPELDGFHEAMGSESNELSAEQIAHLTQVVMEASAIAGQHHREDGERRARERAETLRRKNKGGIPWYLRPLGT